MKTPKVRQPLSRTRSITDMGENPMKTDTSQGNDTDVNRIVARFARTGTLPNNTREPQYGDVTELQGDLTELIQKGEDGKTKLRELKEHEKREKDLQQEKREKRLQYLEEQETIRLQNQPTEPPAP